MEINWENKCSNIGYITMRVPLPPGSLRTKIKFKILIFEVLKQETKTRNEDLLGRYVQVITGLSENFK